MSRLYLADLARARGVSEGTLRVYLHAARTGARRQVRNPPPQPDGHEPAPAGGWRAWWDPERPDVQAYLNPDLGIERTTMNNVMWTLSTDATAGAIQAVASDLRQHQPGITQGAYCTVSGLGTHASAPDWLQELADELAKRTYDVDLYKGN